MPQSNTSDIKKNNIVALSTFRKATPSKKIANYSSEDQRKILNFLKTYTNDHAWRAIDNWSTRNPNNFYVKDNATKRKIIREYKKKMGYTLQPYNDEKNKLKSVKVVMNIYKNNNKGNNLFLKYLINSMKRSVHPNKYPKPNISYKGIGENKVIITNKNRSIFDEIKKIINSSNNNNTKYNKIKILLNK